jgi:hypothetical protein
VFTKTTFALAFALATASGALVGSASAQGWQYYGNATAGTPDFARHDVYGARGTFVGADPDAHVRFDLRRDSDRGH